MCETSGSRHAATRASNFMRQFRDSESKELKQLTASQFMEVWEHYDDDGTTVSRKKSTYYYLIIYDTFLQETDTSRARSWTDFCGSLWPPSTAPTAGRRWGNKSGELILLFSCKNLVKLLCTYEYCIFITREHVLSHTEGFQARRQAHKGL